MMIYDNTEHSRINMLIRHNQSLIKELEKEKEGSLALETNLRRMLEHLINNHFEVWKEIQSHIRVLETKEEELKRRE